MNKNAPRPPDLAELLVRHGARNTPQLLRERLEEEWLADLQTCQGLLSRLRFALGCEWASRIIVLERPELSLANAGDGRALMDRAAPVRPHRTSSLLLVIGLHAGLFYAAWTHLAHTPKPPMVERLSLKPILEPSRHSFRPDGAVNLRRILMTEPPPVTEHEYPEVPQGKALAPPGDESAPPVEPTSDTAHTPVRVTGAPATGFPNLDDFYPAGAIRASAQGVSSVRVCVNPQGRLTADPMLVRPSGAASLDAAALKLAKAGSGHYRPTTEDGQAVTSCFDYAVRFQLRNVR